MGVMVCQCCAAAKSWHYYWVKGPSRRRYKALAALRIASPQEGVVIRSQ